MDTNGPTEISTILGCTSNGGYGLGQQLAEVCLSWVLGAKWPMGVCCTPKHVILGITPQGGVGEGLTVAVV